MYYAARVFPSIDSAKSSTEYFKTYLKKDEGMDEKRFDAFEIPSLVNGKQIPATRVKSDMVNMPKFISEFDTPRKY